MIFQIPTKIHGMPATIYKLVDNTQYLRLGESNCFHCYNECLYFYRGVPKVIWCNKFNNYQHIALPKCLKENQTEIALLEL